jgi:uncharacterized membrane protein
MVAMRYLIVLLALAGVFVSAETVRVHYSTGVEPCNINEKWDCGVVNHSPFAEILHVPVGVLGIGGYLALAGLAFTRQRYLLLLLAICAMGFALRLTLIEELVLEVWCVYCVISQTIIALITALSLGWFTAEYLGLRRKSKAV